MIPLIPYRSPGGSRHRALCIGIDAYPRAPLAGAVADAERWGRLLERRRFDVVLLRDAEATRGRILAELSECIVQSSAGDVVVVAFSGHGTQYPGDGGEERGRARWLRFQRRDSAIVPADVEDGALILDAELGELMAGIPAGVQVTAFFDCCHAGTITRDGVGQRARQGAWLRGRHLPADRAMHESFQRLSGARQRRWPRSVLAMREVCVSACGDGEVAYEIGGAGVFTRAATELLEGRAGASLSNAAFVREVRGRVRRIVAQRPRLACAPWRRGDEVLAGRAA